MTSRELLALGLRVVGMYALVQGVLLAVDVSFFYHSLTEYDDRSLLAANAVLMTAVLLLAAALMAFPGTLSRWLLAGTPSDGKSLAGDIAGLRATAFSVLGVYLVVEAIPHLGAMFSWVLVQPDNEFRDLHAASQLPGAVRFGLQLLLGVGLCLFQVPLDNVLVRFKQWGLRKSG